MVNIVNELKEIAEGLNFTFDYGTRAMLNLMKSNSMTEETYFLLSSPITWTDGASEFGIGNSIASGNFLLLRKSKFGGVAYRSKGQHEDKTKFKNNIVPLLTEAKNIKNKILCTNLKINSWSVIEGFDIFDANLDGLIITFTLEET